MGFQPKNVRGIATAVPRDEMTAAPRRSMAAECLATGKAHGRSEGSWMRRQEESGVDVAGIVHCWRSRGGF